MYLLQSRLEAKHASCMKSLVQIACGCSNKRGHRSGFKEGLLSWNDFAVVFNLRPPLSPSSFSTVTHQEHYEVHGGSRNRTFQVHASRAVDIPILE